MEQPIEYVVKTTNPTITVEAISSTQDHKIKESVENEYQKKFESGFKGEVILPTDDIKKVKEIFTETQIWEDMCTIVELKLGNSVAKLKASTKEAVGTQGTARAPLEEDSAVYTVIRIEEDDNNLSVVVGLDPTANAGKNIFFTNMLTIFQFSLQNAKVKLNTYMFYTSALGALQNTFMKFFKIDLPTVIVRSLTNSLKTADLAVSAPHKLLEKRKFRETLEIRPFEEGNGVYGKLSVIGNSEAIYNQLEQPHLYKKIFDEKFNEEKGNLRFEFLGNQVLFTFKKNPANKSILLESDAFMVTKFLSLEFIPLAATSNTTELTIKFRYDLKTLLNWLNWVDKTPTLMRRGIDFLGKQLITTMFRHFTEAMLAQAPKSESQAEEEQKRQMVLT